jgi:hypothetical protein
LSDSPDSQTYSIKQFFDFVLSPDDNSNCLQPNEFDPIASPHSNSFLDLNGDCVADIYLHRISSQTSIAYGEIYIQMLVNNQSKYCLIQKHEYTTTPNSFPLASFDDMNKNGMIDVIFMEGTIIKVFYNKIKAKDN